MEDNIINYLDFKKVNLLLEGFHKATGFVTAILDLEGNILSNSGWRQICTEFHRQNPETEKRCIISDTELAGNHGKDEKYHIYKCMNGLVDVAVPIIINNEHVANLFSGQFFFEKPNRDFFIEQGKKYKFDNNKYLQALEEVPVFSEEKVRNTMNFLLDMSTMISEMTMQKIEQINLLEKLNISENKLKQNNTRYRKALEIGQIGHWEYLIQTQMFWFSKEARVLFNLETNREFLSKEEAVSYIPEKDRTIKALMRLIEEEKPFDLEFEVDIGGKAEARILKSVAVFEKNNKGKPFKVQGIVIDVSAQKKAEYELQQINIFFEGITENIQDGIWVADKHDVIFYANKAMAKIAGISKKLILGKNVLTDFPKETTEHFNTFYNKAKKDLKPTWYEVSVKTPSGTFTWQNGWLIPVLKNGKCDGIICTIRDITERKKTEELLQESEEKYRALFENAPLSYQSLNEEGRFIDVNPSWLRTLGYERNEVIGKFYADFLHPHWKPHFEKNFPDFKKRGYVHDVQFKIRHKKGHYIDIAFEGCIGYLPDGSFKQTYCVFQDITKRKKIEDLLRQNKNRLEFALEGISMGAWELDLQTHESWRSYEHDKIFGYKEPIKVWTYEMFLEHVIPDDRQHVNEKFTFASQHASEWNFECRIKRLDGKIRWIWAKGQQDYIDNKGVGRMFGIVQDITERKQAEEALISSNKRYQSLFDNSPVPLWEEDFSEAKKLIDELKKDKVKDFIAYFNKHPEKVIECSQMIKITDINKAVLQLHEAKSKEDLLNGLPNIFTDKSYEAFTKELIAIAEGKTKHEFEGTVKTLKGKEKEVFLKWMVVPGYEDTLEKVYISTNDITEQKHIEIMLKESEEKFRGVYEQSPIAIEIYNKDGKLIDVNQQTLAMFGVNDKKYVLGFDLWADPNLNNEKIALLKSGHEIFISTVFDFEKVRENKLYPTSRSGIMYMDMYAIPLISNKKISGFLVQILEVTDRKKAENELKKHRVNLEDLVKERTKELQDKNIELERLNDLFVGREFRIKELRDKIKSIEGK